MQMPRLNFVARAKKIDTILAGTYGKKKQRRRTDPTSELILTILSQNTNDINRDKAYSALKKRFPAWGDLAQARQPDIARTIRVGGLANIKSARIKKILLQIEAKSSDFSLRYLDKMSDEEIWDHLMSFKGVGPKTASCVLLFALGRKAMPVDTHVHRVGLRLGMIPKGYNAEKAHRWFLDLDLPLEIYQFHLNLIAHGRILCRPSHPKCHECPLTRYCRYYSEHVRGHGSSGGKAPRRMQSHDRP